MEPKSPRVKTPLFRPAGRDVVTLLAGLAIFWFLVNGPPSARIGPVDLRFGLTGPAGSIPWKWLGAIALVVLVLRGERRGLASLLLVRPSGKDWEWALYAFGVAMAWSWLAGLLNPQRGNDGIATIAALGVPGVLALIVTAAVTEEIAYRGYLAERLGAILRSRWLGAAASLLVFVVPHVTFFGPSWLAHQLGGTLAIALVVLIRRNLIAGMVVHLLVNAPILIPTVVGAAGAG